MIFLLLRFFYLRNVTYFFPSKATLFCSGFFVRSLPSFAMSL